MGYRSAVAYTIRFVCNQLDASDEDRTKCKDSFYTFLAEAKDTPETALCFGELEPVNMKDRNGEGFYVNEEEMQINFHAWHVKWYNGYKDVDCHEALFSLANDWVDDNDYIGGVKVRIGEELDDNESDVIGTGDNEWLDIGRSIIRDGKEI